MAAARDVAPSATHGRVNSGAHRLASSIDAAAARLLRNVRPPLVRQAHGQREQQRHDAQRRPSKRHATSTQGASSHRRPSSEAALNSPPETRDQRACIAPQSCGQRATSSCPSRGQRKMVSRMMHDVARRGAHVMREEERRRNRLWRGRPRPEAGFLRQPALKGLTRSAWTDSPRRIGQNEFRRSGGGGGGEAYERRGGGG
ncbi:hypothetical protein F511_36984 [Dorcoceras hygrometricum]|uniref:Uncharacterized protein n=1 Tax=Dorcoceras hygrometricum TaxID=472368 RepID=A0A2Z7BUS6_9LAMI|nr:hypothetical protein F511_36984 [Dorcoceras hygrometricum]